MTKQMCLVQKFILMIWGIFFLSAGCKAMPPVVTETSLPHSTSIAKPDSITINTENVFQLQKLGELGLGHAQTAVWANDGKTFAVGGSPGAYVFNVNEERPTHFLPADGMLILLAFSPDKRFLAGQVSNMAIQVWDLSTGHSLYKLEDIGCWNQSMMFSSDGQILYTSCGWWSMEDGHLLNKEKEEIIQPFKPKGSPGLHISMTSVKLLAPESGEVIHTIEMPDLAPSWAEISPDGRTLIVWFYQFEVAHSGVYVPAKDPKSLIQIWNITPGETPTLRATITPGKWHQAYSTMLEGFHGLVFTPDNQRFITASGDNQVQIWDTTSSQLLHTLPDGNWVYLSAGGNQLITIGKDVQIWDISPETDPTLVKRVSDFTNHGLIGYTEDGQKLVTEAKGIFQFWSTDGTIFDQQPTIIKTTDFTASVMAVSPDGSWLAFSTMTELWLGENNSGNPNWQVLEKFSDEPFVLGTQAIVFSPDSSLLATVDADRRILIWRLKNLENGPAELARNLYVANLIFSPNGKWLLSVPGPSTEEQLIYLWDPITGELLKTQKVKGDQFAFHPDGKKLALTDYSNNTIFIYDLQSWQLLQQIEGEKGTRHLAFSTDGSLLATTGERGINIWEVSTGKQLKTIEGSFRQLNFSLNGFAVSLYDGRIQYWGILEK